MYWLLSYVVVVTTLVTPLLHAADKTPPSIIETFTTWLGGGSTNQGLPPLPADAWALVIKKSHKGGAKRLRERGKLSVVSKSMAAQQPDLAQLELKPEDVERWMWEFDPVDRPKTVKSLVYLHLDNKFWVAYQVHKEPSCLYYTTKNLLHKAIDKETTHIVYDTERAKLMAQVGADKNNRDAKLLHGMIPYSTGSDQCDRRKAIAHALIKAGDSVLYVDKDGITALHKAIVGPSALSKKEPSVVLALLEAGAVLDAKVDTTHFSCGTFAGSRRGDKMTAYEMLISQWAEVYYRTSSTPYMQPHERKIKAECLTPGQKLVIAGGAFSPGSDAVPQILNNYLGKPVLPHRVTRLSALKPYEAHKFLAMDMTGALKVEKNDPICSIQ